MYDGLDVSTVRNFGTALLIGALVGTEREKRQSAEAEAGIGGLRTFVLLALLGAVAGWLADALHMPALLVAVLIVVGAAVLAGYVLAARVDPASLGLTTESAAITVYLLGAMATLGYRELAVALAIVTAALLAYKQPLHGLVEKMSWDDIFAGLRLLIATFIVLPLLPSRSVDPWGALNPYSLWLLVLLISSLSLVGYVGSRWLGADRGIVLTGLTGGLVSSTAVTLSFARQSRDDSRTATAHTLACGMLLAWCIMFGRVIVEVLVVNRELVGRVLIPFAMMGAAAAVAAWVFFSRSAPARDRAAAKTEEVPLRNPFSLTEASKFGAFFAVVLLAVKFVQIRFPGEGLYMVAGLAGLTDVDAITLSMAEYARSGDAHVAVNAIVLATLTNTMVKCGMAVALGGAVLRRPVLIATGAILATGIGAISWL
ncbi:MAG: MgtC/SapB family protein [Deltaproteobacteria bacterium]|nr:MAG: MgtC/SapB family protein [Deltaproteobacteria bacterium]